MKDTKQSNIPESVLGLIGNTPIVKINKINLNNKVNIYAKLEGQNPGGSVKDRIALSMIAQAENEGSLSKDKIILEPTSGNTGIGLALVASLKGYRVILTMSEGMSMERKRMLAALGAELIETPAEEGTDGAIRKAHQIFNLDPEKYWMPNQFSNKWNPYIHYKRTSDEIIRDIPEVTAFIAGMGTSGTLMGVGKRLKEYNKNIDIVGVEPELGHNIQGLKNMKEAIVPAIYKESDLDLKIEVRTDDAYIMARRLAKEEGLFVGMSSGAAMFGAVEYAQRMKEGNIVVLFPDRGEKYLSTGLFI